MSLLFPIIMMLNPVNSKRINRASPPTGKGYTPAFHSALWFSEAFCGCFFPPHTLSAFSCSNLGPYLFIKLAVYLSPNLLAGAPPAVLRNCHIALFSWPGCKEGCCCCSYFPPTRKIILAGDSNWKWLPCFAANSSASLQQQKLSTK